MHNYTISVFFLLLSSYVYCYCCHLQGDYTKLSLKHTAINELFIAHQVFLVLLNDKCGNEILAF